MNEQSYTTTVLVGRAKLWSEDHDWPSVTSRSLCWTENGWGALQRTNPGHHHAHRTATAQSINPLPYHADYFRHKLHVDQNESLLCLV